MSQILSIHTNIMSPLIEAVSELIKKVNLQMKRARDVRATVRELQGLTNRELADLGISRGEIYSIANQTADAVYGTTNENLKGWV